MACGTCIGECPVGAISEGADKYSIDPEACVECGTCAEACPAGAISLGEEYNPNHWKRQGCDVTMVAVTAFFYDE